MYYLVTGNQSFGHWVVQIFYSTKNVLEWPQMFGEVVTELSSVNVAEIMDRNKTSKYF